jgi:nucleoside-diphosphate-sugar epimerase
MTEEWPTRPASRLFYAREKAELEGLLQEQAAAVEEPALYLVRPPIVLGPHAMGAKDLVPAPLAGVGSAALGVLRRLPIPLPAPAPDFPLQFIHEDDVGQALLRCVLGDGSPGAYNIAGDGVVTGADIARELGLTAIPIPPRAVQAAARLASAVPRPSFVPPSADWVEAASHPAIMDTTKARTELGWNPRYSGIEALRATLRPE